MSNAISPYHYLSAQGSESISLNDQEQYSPFLYVPQSEFVVNPFPNYIKTVSYTHLRAHETPEHLVMPHMD